LTTRARSTTAGETRRQREPGHDWVIVRLGAAGIVREVVVDTANARSQIKQIGEVRFPIDR
jgi:allantoicase